MYRFVKVSVVFSKKRKKNSGFHFAQSYWTHLSQTICHVLRMKGRLIRWQRPNKAKVLALSRSLWNICCSIWSKEENRIWFAIRQFEKHPSTRLLLGKHINLFAEWKETEGTAVRANWKQWRCIQICSVAPRHTADVTLTGFFFFFCHSEPNHRLAYLQRRQSTVAYDCRGGKIAISRHGRRSPGVSLQFH